MCRLAFMARMFVRSFVLARYWATHGRIFETVDVADLGDHHYDPFVHKVESLDAVLQGVASPRR